MLCEKCSNIVLERDASGELLNSHREYVYYRHYNNQQALKESMEGCHFCWKLWHGFKALYSLQNARAGQPSHTFEDSTPTPIWLHIWLKDEWTTDRPKNQVWQGELLYASCGRLELCTSVWIWSLDEALTEIFHAQPNLSPPVQRRALDPKLNSNTNLRLARFWLDTCETRHDSCHKASKDALLPLRVLDVSDSTLTKLVAGNGNCAAYTTLSYKWGDGKKYLLDSDTLQDLENGVTTDLLPPTFADAARTAHCLGFKYIWIDALCIKQDSPQEMNEQIALMGDIYRGSSLTIFAAGGESAHAGLGTPRDPILVQPTRIPLAARLKDWTVRNMFYVDMFTGRWGGMDMYRPHSDDKLPLFQRGWVLQEEILSQRALLFTNDEIKWRCLCDTASERNPKMKTRDVIKVTSNFTTDRFGGLRIWMLGKDPMERERRRGTHERYALFDEWYRLVEGYSLRRLSFVSDTLPALSGIATALHQLQGYTYYSGIWAEDIQLGLLWRVVHATSNLKTHYYDNSMYMESLDTGVTPPGTRNKRAQPSWSWISQSGSARTIRFEHKRKYWRREDLGLQIVDMRVKYHPFAKNVYGEVLGATLSVDAYVKWAELRLSDEPTSWNSDRGWEQSAYKLYDLGKIGESKQHTKPLAEFWPDDIDPLLGERGKLYVLCVLCAVAPLQYDQTLKTPTMITAISVVPSWEQKGAYRRVGLAMFHKNDWFGSDGYGYIGVCGEDWKPADGAERMTLDLI